MTITRTGLMLAVAVTAQCGLSTYASAEVSAQEAAKLGKELTCVGAEQAGNAEGTIPPYTGKYLGEVPGWQHVKFSGDHPVDPYAAEKPIAVITAQNMSQYEAHLTEGQKALLKKYPTTYKMNIYPGHRDFRYPDYVCRRAMDNALHAKLVNDGAGFTGLGQVPFPIPKNGMELLWNHQLPARAWTEEKTSDLASVLPNGSIGWGRALARNLAPANSPVVDPSTDGKIQSLSNNMTLKPARDNGTLNIAHEPYNFATDARQAWTYSPSTRRVRQLPGYGYDQPMIGTNGTMTVDEDRLYNGSPERYTWKLIGKREIYTPANAFKANAGTLKYADILTPNHPNPDVMRYELRRVWVLQADLKEGFRHVYGKRVLFIDEDTWNSVLADNYDARGQLWKHAMVNYYYHPDMSGWQAGSQFFMDLNSGQYTGYGMTNESKKGPILNEGKYTPDQYTADAARASGR
ncbi:DUF1329 domain-containing protein [Pseudomonas sp. FSL R10-2172]|nr:DUF1329 domain-containing protein [Pseudomonas sp. FSL R10-0765]MQT50390.1 DUF1329 domain-containing protein [Pseudomonas sp. FSL R10-2398]MQT99905.1 DUF1329 domain-containing protein [Pseudomonas sp. FSL R10-2245]MQU13052.1 DUF1329 domain-containing protein [Pseudomonas sp. FSL R10-2189]MQU37551.1 DUF1329 domain-containing protein [Pseudomonas sp. FSL R10-2172]